MRSILNLDMPIANAPMARWQRTARSGSPGKSIKGQCMPCKAGGDRFIPCRNDTQMDVARFLLSKEKEPVDPNASLASSESQKAWSVTLNGYDIEEAKILHFGGKPLYDPEGYQSKVRVQVPTPVSSRGSRLPINLESWAIALPDVMDDFYFCLNAMDWGSQNVLAVGLIHSVHLLDESGLFCDTTLPTEGYVCSVSWVEGNYLAIGTSDHEVKLWDLVTRRFLRTMGGHNARVGSLSWNCHNHLLSSASGSGHVHLHDIRAAGNHFATLTGHTDEVCGLKWSTDGKHLASGGSDGLVCVWSERGSHLCRFRDHQGAVKALAWCPWQPNHLASGGGMSDQHIHIWDVNTGSCITSVDTESEISSLVFAPNYKELVSGHGSPDRLTIWKYPSMTALAVSDWDSRILNLALSPDSSSLASIAADRIVEVSKCFVREAAKNAPGSITHQGIR